MNWDRIEGNWDQYKGRVKACWDKITYVNLQVIAGRRDQLIGRIQDTYGITRDEAERQLEAWEMRNERVVNETPRHH